MIRPGNGGRRRHLFGARALRFFGGFDPITTDSGRQIGTIMHRKKASSVVKPTPPPLSESEIAERLKNALLRFVSYAQPAFPAQSTHDFRSYRSEFLGFLRLGKYKDDAERIIKICQNQEPIEAEHFTARLSDREHHSVPIPSVMLKADADWTDARSEAARLLEIPPMPLVTAKALELYDWLVRPEHRGKTWTSRELSERFKIDHISDLLWRLYFHHDSRLRISKTDHWSHSVQLVEEPAPELTLPALNPTFPRLSKKFTKTELEDLRRFFEDLILSNAPSEGPFVVARIGTRRELAASLPYVEDSALAPQNFYEAFGKMPAIPGARLFYNFSHAQGPWIIGVYPAEGIPWNDVQKAIEERRAEISPQEKYGLSAMAGAVLAWLLDQNFESFSLHLSPNVEDELKLGIGIDLEAVGDKNLWELFDLMGREITEKTEFEARPVRWADRYYPPKICFFFRRKADLEENAVRAVQALLRKRGCNLNAEQILMTIEGLASH